MIVFNFCFPLKNRKFLLIQLFRTFLFTFSTNIIRLFLLTIFVDTANSVDFSIFDYSEEFCFTKGLGIIRGHVKHISTMGNIEAVPHVGWNKIKINLENYCNMAEFDKKFFYFVHSYVGIPEKKEHILSLTKIGNIEFCSAIQSNKIVASQFHPEKSGIMGLRLMEKFLNGGKKN